jgi:hypothetical protein
MIMSDKNQTMDHTGLMFHGELSMDNSVGHVINVTPPNATSFQFMSADNQTIVGRFYMENDKLHFEGNLDESAETFVKQLKVIFNAS